MGKKHPTQHELLIKHMRAFGSITKKEAMNEYGIGNPGARIGELRMRGYDIDTEMVDGINRYGEKMLYAKYILLGEPKEVMDNDRN